MAVLTEPAQTAGEQLRLLEIGRTLLQEEMDRRFAALQDLIDERRDSAERMNLQRHNDLKELMLANSAAAKEAVQAALVSAEKAVGKAEVATEKRLEHDNGFRAQLSDQAAHFSTRDELAAQSKTYDQIIAVMRNDIAQLTSVVVPRTETEAWRKNITDSLDALYTRMDVISGERAASIRNRDQSRLDITTIMQFVSVLVAIGAVILVVYHK